MGFNIFSIFFFFFLVIKDKGNILKPLENKGILLGKEKKIKTDIRFLKNNNRSPGLNIHNARKKITLNLQFHF